MSLLFAGEAFENLLVIVGSMSLDPTIRKHFTSSQKLQAASMIVKLFETKDKELTHLVNQLGRFDRSSPTKSFEQQLKQILSLPRPEAREFGLAVLVRNFYSHESLSWNSIVTTNTEEFAQVHESIIAAIVRLYSISYSNQYFLPPVDFKEIDVPELSSTEKKARVRVGNILWGWVDEPLLAKTWKWLEKDRVWNEFENPIPEISLYDFIRSVGFLTHKRLITVEKSANQFHLRLTEEAARIEKKEPPSEPEPIIVRVDKESTQEIKTEVTEAEHRIPVMYLKLTPTAKRYLVELFGIRTAGELEESFRGNPTYLVQARTREGRRVFINDDIVLETVEKSFSESDDMKTVDGFLVVGVRQTYDLRRFGIVSKYERPLSVLP
jgi:hypothetical protein